VGGLYSGGRLRVLAAGNALNGGAPACGGTGLVSRGSIGWEIRKRPAAGFGGAALN